MKKSWPFVLSALVLAITACTHQQPGQDTLSNVAIQERPSGIATQSVLRRERVTQREQSPSLIDRLREGMTFSDGLDTSNFQDRLDWHRSNPTYLPLLLGRGERYLHYIIEELDKAELPAELALIPIIESGFDPFAYSPGHAAGMWQFIPATGERFGLTRDWWWAGRRDVIDSTAAAVAYLDYLNGLFDGDWLLTLAAYNAGEGTVRRAVSRNRAAGKPTDFWSLPLPRETRQYIPAILALAEVLRDPEEYGIALPDLTNEPYFQIVELAGPIRLQTAAALAGIDQDELLQLNPAVRRGTLSPEGPHRLLVPARQSELFLDSLASLPQSEWMPATLHTVERGDTLSGIASRYRVSVPALQRMNDLSGTTIRAGQRLQIPGGGDPGQAVAAAAGQPQQHVVRQGESLWTIARQHNLTVANLARWNQLDREASLRAGQSLKISNPGAISGGGDSSARQVSYRIREGDSLYRIAQQFNIQVRDIMQWNKLDGNSILQPGQGLVLYLN